MKNFQMSNSIDAGRIFEGYFLDNRALYFYRFGCVPNIHYTGGIEGEKACAAFRERYGHLVESEYQYRQYDRQKKKYPFAETLFVLTNGCIVEIDTYCDILHDGTQPQFIEDCAALMLRFRQREKRAPVEINLVMNGHHGLTLKPMEIKRTRMDVELYYGKEFVEVDALIRKRLGRSKDRGVVLLHGLPGTGKTTYLRYLIGRLKKRVLFLSPEMAGDLMNPRLMELLIENPDTILVVEDAEQVIMDRRTGHSGVSSLLNISDGLLADFLNIQLVCTFNSALTVVDGALMRPGRLIASHAFGKLGREEAQRLSDHLGFDTTISEPMTLSAIVNQKEKNFDNRQVEVIGFRTGHLHN